MCLWLIIIGMIALVFLLMGGWNVRKLFRNDNDAFRNKLLMRYCRTTDDAEVDGLPLLMLTA
jgi:FtsZ-interacting cell division protein ZipA